MLFEISLYGAMSSSVDKVTVAVRVDNGGKFVATDVVVVDEDDCGGGEEEEEDTIEEFLK